MKVTGYIVGLANPDSGALATVQIAELANARQTYRPGKMTTAYIEADRGIKQLAAFFGGLQNLTLHAGGTKLAFDIDDGVIKSFVSAEEN